MATTLLTINKGDSFSIAFVLPEGYNQTRINAIKVRIGSKIYIHTVSEAGLVECELTSEQTSLLTGLQSVIFTIDDDVFGVKVIVCGEINVRATNETYTSDSVNTGNNVLVTLTLTETAIQVTDVLYDYVKGAQGEQGIQGIQGIQGQAGTNGTNGLTPYIGDNGNWWIGSTDTGVAAEAEIKTTILRKDATFQDGYLKLPYTDSTNYKVFRLFYAKLVTGLGDEHITPIIKFPPSLTYNGTPYHGFYVSCAEYPNLQTADWDSITLEYTLTTESTLKYDCLNDVIGDNVIINEYVGDEYHSAVGVKTFEAVYPDFAGEIIETVKDSLTNNTALSKVYEPYYMPLKKADAQSHPYSAGALSINLGNNPNILNVSSHYNNIFARHDITADANTFLPNAIAVGARVDDETTQAGTSYGYGIEFFEPANNVTMNSDYPDVTNPLIVAWGTLSGGGLTLTSTHPTFNFNDCLQIAEGAKIGIGDINGITGQTTIASIESNTQVTLSDSLTWAGGTMYIYIPEALIGTIWQPKASTQDYYQSPTCTIIMAKFKMIKDATKVNWQIVREAARATASNNGVWDMYRGFGIVNVAAAIEYIQDNYLTAQDVENFAIQENHKNGINPILGDSDILPDTPLPKRISDVKFAPVIHDHAGQSINPDNIIINKSYTDAEAAELEIGSTFYNSDQLCWMTKFDADVYYNWGSEMPILSKIGDNTAHLNGMPVYITSGSGNLNVVSLTNSTIGKADAMATEDVANTGNKRGYYTYFGAVRSIPRANIIKSTDNSANWVEGAELRLCSETGKLSTATEAAPAKCPVVARITAVNGANVTLHFTPNKSIAMSDLSDVDGTDTTIADTDEIIKKDASVWKSVTWANVKTLLAAVFESLSNKKTSLTDNSDTFYPSQKAVKTAVDAKANLSGGNTLSGTQNISNVLQQVAGQYFYQCASLTADTLNDVRYYVSAGVTIFEVCTVANATKGSGTWTESMRFDNVNKRIGVGKSPSYAVDVTGVISASSGVYASSLAAGFNSSNFYGTNAGVMTLSNASTNAASALALKSKDTEFLRGLPTQDVNMTAGKYFYMAASPTADTLNDIRSYVSTNITIYQICTVANATKGSGTWTNLYAISELGAYMVSFNNKTGANSVKGTVVSVSDTTDNAVRVNPIDGDMPIGVIYNSGIADGSQVWVVISGVAEVLLVDTIATTRSYVAYSSATTAGRIDTSATAPAATTHFRETGHTLESKTGGTNVLVKCIIHFN